MATSDALRSSRLLEAAASRLVSLPAHATHWAVEVAAADLSELGATLAEKQPVGRSRGDVLGQAVEALLLALAAEDEQVDAVLADVLPWILEMGAVRRLDGLARAQLDLIRALEATPRDPFRYVQTVPEAMRDAIDRYAGLARRQGIPSEAMALALREMLPVFRQPYSPEPWSVFCDRCEARALRSYQDPKYGPRLLD